MGGQMFLLPSHKYLAFKLWLNAISTTEMDRTQIRPDPHPLPQRFIPSPLESAKDFFPSLLVKMKIHTE